MNPIMKSKKFIVANWKMNPQTAREAVRLARGEDANNVIICPPFPFLSAVGRALREASLGAQDVFWGKEGAYTGEVSAAMLRAAGANYVIVGHSERRRFLGETDAMIAEKVAAGLKERLNVILCVGEPAHIHKKGMKSAVAHVKRQLSLDLQKICIPLSRLFIAYEPLWAIGSGTPDTSHDAARMAVAIKNHLASRILRLAPRVLYGGSVTSKNARNFLQCKELDGAMVGGASLHSNEFRTILSSIT